MAPTRRTARMRSGTTREGYSFARYLAQLGPEKGRQRHALPDAYLHRHHDRRRSRSRGLPPRLFARDRRFGQLRESPVHSRIMGAPSGVNRAAPSTSSVARVLGRYVLHAELAAGGMATVHLGRLKGEAGFARTVAIKRLHPQFAKDPEFVVMFLDEARLAARIRHPNVVPTLDVVDAERRRDLPRHGVRRGRVALAAAPGAHAKQRLVPAAHRDRHRLRRAPRAPRGARGEERQGDAARHRPSRRLPAERARRDRRRRARPRLRRRKGGRPPSHDARGAAQGQARVHGSRAARGRPPDAADRRVRRCGRSSGRR